MSHGGRVSLKKTIVAWELSDLSSFVQASAILNSVMCLLIFSPRLNCRARSWAMCQQGHCGVGMWLWGLGENCQMSQKSFENLCWLQWWVWSISVPGNHQSEWFYLIATSVSHSTVNQKPPETSPDALHSIKDQFHIKFMINHISFTSIPPIPIFSTQQHLPILLLPLFPKLQILATVFPLFSLHLHFKKNQGLFYILACFIYLWFLSIPLFSLDLILLVLI